MARIKYTLDYVIKSSPTILYNFLTNPSGLSQWFADHVDSLEDSYSFFWDGYEEKAKVLELEENNFIKFRMDEAEEDEFLEFRIEKSPVTGDTILIITDFADDDDKEDQVRLWNSQIKSLISRVGGSN